MEKNLVLDFKPTDEISDTISTSAASYNYIPLEESSPSNTNSPGSVEGDILDKTRKIRKKRNAYKKIDDNIRLQLLNSVQRGETLKSAAKRLQVNYSSAKSIFHIYRKEGRILKKATQERPFEVDYPVQQPIKTYPFFPQNPNPTRMNTSFQAMMFPQQFENFQPNRNVNTTEEITGCPSPLTGLVDNFADLLKIGGAEKASDDYVKNNKNHMPIFPSRFQPKTGNTDNNMIPKNPLQSFIQMQANTQMPPSMLMQHNMSSFANIGQQSNSPMHATMALQQGIQMQPNPHIAFACKQNSQARGSPAHAMISPAHAMMSPAHAMKSPAQMYKQFDNFYMNYSNSPLSGNARMMKESSESGSNKYVQGEFDSFSEMVSAFQVQIPKLVLPNMQPQSQEKTEFKGPGDDELDWNGSIENASIRYL